MKRFGILMATTALGAALVASTPAAAFRSGHMGGWHGGGWRGAGWHGDWNRGHGWNNGWGWGGLDLVSAWLAWAMAMGMGTPMITATGYGNTPMITAMTTGTPMITAGTPMITALAMEPD